MKTIIVIFILITTPVFAGMVKIETGESGISDKLAKIGAAAKPGRSDDEWKTWLLPNADGIIEISVYKENLVEDIIVWDNNTDYYLNRSMAMTREDAERHAEEANRRRVRSISFDTDTKLVQIEKYSGTITVAVGDTEVKGKLKNAGARDLWNTRALINLTTGECGHEGEKDVNWSLTGSNDTSNYIRVEVLAPKGIVSTISYWTAPIRDLMSEERNRRYARSFTYNPANKTLQVDKNTEMVKIDVGDTDVIDKLLKIGAKDIGHLKAVAPQPAKNTVWALSDSSINVEIWLDKGQVAGIYFWDTADVRATKAREKIPPHYTRSLSYNTANKKIQVGWTEVTEDVKPIFPKNH